MSITTALKARQEALRDREAGFTLIELLVVVIIIGILAAIAIPVYLGVQNNAKDSAVKSDLVNAKTAIVTFGTDNNGSLPTAITAAGVASPGDVPLSRNGWSKSSNTDNLKYVAGTGGTWCVVGSNDTTQKAWVISSTTQVNPGTYAAAASLTCTAS